MSAQSGGEPPVMLTEIDATECATLLAATRYGRMAVVDGGRPHLVVLNHLVLTGNVLFRVDIENRLAQLTDGLAIHAVYEVDSAFPVGRSGWSVIVEGLLVREPDQDLAALAREQITAWAGGRRDVVLGLRIDQLTGRRAGPL